MIILIAYANKLGLDKIVHAYKIINFKINLSRCHNFNKAFYSHYYALKKIQYKDILNVKIPRDVLILEAPRDIPKCVTYNSNKNNKNNNNNSKYINLKAISHLFMYF